MNITYTQNGDYLIPNIVIRKTKPHRTLRQTSQKPICKLPPYPVQ